MAKKPKSKVAAIEAATKVIKAATKRIAEVKPKPKEEVPELPRSIRCPECDFRQPVKGRYWFSCENKCGMIIRIAQDPKDKFNWVFLQPKTQKPQPIVQAAPAAIVRTAMTNPNPQQLPRAKTPPPEAVTPRPRRKAVVMDRTLRKDLVTAIEIAEDLNITPRELRILLRKLKWEKPDAGWAWSQKEVKSVVLKLKLALKPKSKKG